MRRIVGGEVWRRFTGGYVWRRFTVGEVLSTSVGGEVWSRFVGAERRSLLTPCLHFTPRGFSRRLRAVYRAELLTTNVVTEFYVTNVANL